MSIQCYVYKLTSFETLLESVEVGRAARHAVDAHFTDAAALHFAYTCTYYERDIAFFSPGNIVFFM